ncbi:MAG: hypothetical protein VXW00_13420, partial [Candidatus Latescibacterota bacterium]|nr:hypothetical protein [Candidatus Latescibacterota bacterium]
SASARLYARSEGGDLQVAIKVTPDFGCYFYDDGQAGDVVIFTETLTHGTLPWNGAHERRALLYKFSPGSLAYGSGAHAVDYPDYIGDMSEEERAVMEAPHLRR